jgi:outer membrane protein TolC
VSTSDLPAAGLPAAENADPVALTANQQPKDLSGWFNQPVVPASGSKTQASAISQIAAIGQETPDGTADTETDAPAAARPILVQPPEIIMPPPGQPVDASQRKRAAGGTAADGQASENGGRGNMAGDGAKGPADGEDPGVETLKLDDVVISVRNAYPKIREAVARQQQAAGEITAALGNFDTVLDGETINQPLGFYENYRHRIGLTRPLISGGYAKAGYRLGDGFFEPWYGGRETDEGGEFKIGIDIPLLQGREIDKRRTELRTAELRRGQTDPELQLEILNTQGDAAIAYWTWVTAGLNVRVQRALLDLARDRVAQIARQIELGDVEAFRGLDNDRLIASRQIKLIDAERKFGQSAVKLSLYLRDAQGMPLIPPANSLPEEFPSVNDLELENESLVAMAIQQRPETRILQFDASALRVQLAQATNQLLPTVNLALETQQDVGGKTSSKGDKQPAVIEAGVYGEVPLQRRAARGKMESLQAKLRQVDAKLQLAGDQIATDVRRILVAREAAVQQIAQAKLNLQLAEQTLELGNIGLREGQFTLAILNIYEQAVADAQAALLVAQGDFFIADSLLQISTGRVLDLP